MEITSTWIDILCKYNQASLGLVYFFPTFLFSFPFLSYWISIYSIPVYRTEERPCTCAYLAPSSLYISFLAFSISLSNEKVFFCYLYIGILISVGLCACVYDISVYIRTFTHLFKFFFSKYKPFLSPVGFRFDYQNVRDKMIEI